jgi:phosphoenolpyruvate phosphomutase
MKLLRFLPRFRQAYRELATLEAREHWSRSDIDAWQLERLNVTWQHAIAHVPHYRRLTFEARLPERFDSLDEFRSTVPVLPKQAVRDQPDAILSEKAESGHWTRTGGSTGTPMNAYWATNAHLESLRCKYRFQAAWGLDIFDRTAYVWGHSASFKPGLAGRIARWRQPLEDLLRNRIRLSAYHLGQDSLREYLRRIASFQPAVLYGYSRALALLALEAVATGFRCDSLKLVIMTGEPAFPNLVETIERGLGVPAVAEYGSVECGFMAGEGPDRYLRVREDIVLMETLPREDGRHDIVVSVLNHPSFPLLRYAIGDVTDAPLQRGERGFARLQNVAGRNNDLIISRSGRYLHSARFDALFKYETKVIRRFRVRQHADGSLAVALELNDPKASLDNAGLERKLSELVEGYPVKIEVVETLPQTAAGKHRLVVSDLDVANQPVGARRLNNVHSAPQSQNGHQNPSNVGHIGNGKAHNLPTPSAIGLAKLSKAGKLKALIRSPELSFIMEAHNGLSSKIVEEAGFEAIWASGLSISAALGVRDSNEASWTQVLEVLEFMSDNTRIPILVDGDTGYGNFNNMRRLVCKLEQRGIAGVCIEDKVFPKTNSFINGTAQPLADIEEFCGRIKAGKDAQKNDEFVVVARVEAFIAGWGLQEALRRAEAYRKAGADAILIHSALRSANEILSFKEEWGDRLPVVIVPTKYYATPTEVFRKYGFSAIIWANHLMRSCITAMQRTASQIFEEQNLVRVEDRVTPLAEVFRLQGAHELEEAEKRYLPKNVNHTRAIVLAASRGKELGTLTESRPKCMVAVSGAPILAHIASSYRAAGIKDIAVVRGYRRDTVNVEGLRYFDNEEAEATGEVHSLHRAVQVLEGHCIISYGDVLFKKYVPQELMDLDADFAVVVDTSWRESHTRGRRSRYVTCSEESIRKSSCCPVRLLDISTSLDPGVIHGEWMGFLKVSAAGNVFLRDLLDRLVGEAARLRTMDLPELMREIVRAGKEVRVIYTTGHWLDVDSVEDVEAGGSFQ